MVAGRFYAPAATITPVRVSSWGSPACREPLVCSAQVEDHLGVDVGRVDPDE
jgi:hypothetical protein